MWKKRKYRKGTEWREGRKSIWMHKALGKYWIDYSIDDYNEEERVLGTMKPVKTLKEAMKQVNYAKREFQLHKK